MNEAFGGTPNSIQLLHIFFKSIKFEVASKLARSDTSARKSRQGELTQRHAMDTDNRQKRSSETENQKGNRTPTKGHIKSYWVRCGSYLQFYIVQRAWTWRKHGLQ